MVYEGLIFRVMVTESFSCKIYTINNIGPEYADINWNEGGDRHTANYRLVDINKYFEEGSWKVDNQLERLKKLKKLKNSNEI